jgi:hypothetical protein
LAQDGAEKPPQEVKDAAAATFGADDNVRDIWTFPLLDALLRRVLFPIAVVAVAIDSTDAKKPSRLVLGRSKSGQAVYASTKVENAPQT